MGYPNDDCKLHFIGVEVVQLVFSSNPFRIKSYRVHATFYLLGLFFRLSVTIARTKDVQWNREEFVVDPPRKESEGTHHQYKIADSVNIWKEFFRVGIF